MTVNTPDGAAALGAVAMTLGRAGMQIKGLDDADTDLGRCLHGDDRDSDRGKRRVAVTGIEPPVSSGAKQVSSTTFGRSQDGPSARSHVSPPSVLPAVFVPAFFYAVNLGALEKLAGTALDYKAFLLPMAIAFAVTGCPGLPPS